MPLLKFLKEMQSYFILHAVAAHFSNGLVPVAALFFTLALLGGDPALDRSVLHLLVVVLLAAPLSLASGILDWRRKFHGRTAPIFTRKILLSIALLVLNAVALTLRLTHPDLLRGGGPLFWLYALCLLLMLGAVVLLGHYGAKLMTMALKSPPPADGEEAKKG